MCVVEHVMQRNRVTVIVHFFAVWFVSLVNLRICIRMVKFCRSTNDVETCFGSGSPLTTFMSQPMHFAGE